MTTTIMRVSFGGDNGAGRSAGETAQKSTVIAVEVHDVAFGKLLAPGIGSVDIDEDTLQLARAALNILKENSRCQGEDLKRTRDLRDRNRARSSQ